jgi:hypothetical protein
MKNTREIIVKDLDGKETTHIIIQHNENEYTSMPKSTYDEQQAAKSTPIVSSDV